MKRAITEAKLKCRYCQSVFVGTTRLAPEVLPPEDTLPVHVPQPEMATQYHRLPRRRFPALQAGIVLLGLAVAFILGAWLYHNYGQSKTVIVLPPPPAVEVPSPVPLTEADAVFSSSADDSQAASGKSVASEESAESDASAARQANGHTKIASPVEVVECARLEGPAEASATFVGMYENHSDTVLRSVQVVVMVSQPNGEMLQAASHRYEAIPPHWRSRFSADAEFRFEPGMRIGWVEAHSEPAPELRGWAVEDVTTDVNDDETINVSGKVQNASNQPLVNPVIRCDFFTRQGLYVGSSQGTLRGNPQTLAPGEIVAYDIHFDPSQAGSSSRLLAEGQPRLLGTTNP